MGYLSKGYYTICSSPVFSFILLLVLTTPNTGPVDELLWIIHNLLVMGIQVCGIALCVLGWRKHETIESLVKPKQKDYVSIYIPFSVALSVLPILWGSWIIYLEYFTLNYEKPSWLYHLTTTDYFFHITSILIGAIALFTGLIFLVRVYIWKSPKTDLQKTEQ
jgi:hypothetical protein